MGKGSRPKGSRELEDREGVLRLRRWERYTAVANSQGNDHGVGGREGVQSGELRNRESRCSKDHPRGTAIAKSESRSRDK